MKVFYYSFDGEALGGEMIVVAESLEEAEKIAETELRSRYKRLKDPVWSLDLKLEDSCELELGVIHYWNGDY